MGVCCHLHNLQHKRNDIMHKWNQDDRQGDHRKRCQGDTIAENYFCILNREHIIGKEIVKKRKYMKRKISIIFVLLLIIGQAMMAQKANYNKFQVY